MEISADFIVFCDLKKLGISGTYPEKDNCYIVEITNKKSGVVYTEQYLPKHVFHCWEKLNELRGVLSLKDIEDLCSLFNDCNYYGYNKASIEAAEEAAGEDI